MQANCHSKREYLSQCKEQNQLFFKNTKHIVRYVKNKENRKIGVLVAFVDSNKVLRIGWSKCHAKFDVFNAQIGVRKAIDRAIPLGHYIYVACLNLNLGDLDTVGALDSYIDYEGLRIPYKIRDGLQYMFRRAIKWIVTPAQKQLKTQINALTDQTIA